MTKTRKKTARSGVSRFADRRIEEDRLVAALQADHSYVVALPGGRVQRTVMLVFPPRGPSGARGRGRAVSAIVLKLVVPEDSWIAGQAADLLSRRSGRSGRSAARSRSAPGAAARSPRRRSGPAR